MARERCCIATVWLAFGLAACAGDTPPRAGATIQEIMVSKVNPAAAVLWGAAGLESTTAGTVDLAPKNDAEWEKVRRGVEALMEAADLLTLPGRRVAPQGATLADASTPGNLKAPDIQTGIDNDWYGFVRDARNLRNAGVEALVAVKERNAEKLAEAGETVTAACGACHDSYWYPNSIQPVQ